jgi:hypothetical protein
MSALLPKADMGSALAHVCLGQKRTLICFQAGLVGCGIYGDDNVAGCHRSFSSYDANRISVGEFWRSISFADLKDHEMKKYLKKDCS